MTNKSVLRMKDDIMFKAFFSKKGNQKFLEDFIGAILERNVKINKIIHDARLEQTSREEKYGVLDLDVELEGREKVNLEMQLRDNKNIERRTTFYGSKKLTEQLKIGNLYENLKKVIIIAILDYSFIPYEEYVTETVRVASKHREYELNNDIKYYYIELAKFRKQNPDMKNKLNQWLAFLDRERGDLLEMAKKENELVNKADEEYNVLTGDAELKRLEEIRMLSSMEEHSALLAAKNEGKAEGKAEGRIEGEIKGEKKSKISIAKKLLSMNMSIDQVCEATGLSKDEVKKLQADLNG